ncbi:MAG: TonB-dependent receptor [Bacteroidetes bacterium]|jgi:outer membrane receptor protein involved in Fe transport|nr:TonB-dependent receptor [Bacteroidota bacterium]
MHWKGLVLLVFGIICQKGLASTSYCQIEGRVTDEKGASVPFASVLIENTSIGTVTDEHGKFSFKTTKTGRYSIIISYLGYEIQKKPVTLEQGKLIQLDITLQSIHTYLDEVVVQGKSEEQLKREEPIKIEVLTTKKLQSQSVDLSQVLKQTTGVIIRQMGGLGSETNISLNGLTGHAVRIYYDGIPLDVYGGGIQINNLPVDAIEKVEVYKGVMPVGIGTDALGGGVNLVPYKTTNDHVRAAYSFGSFNTHKANLSGHKNIGEKLSVSAMGFYNYSDNNYVMRSIRSGYINTLDDGTQFLKEEIIDAERFHSTHSSGFINLSARFKKIGIADQLTISGVFSERYDELQHGLKIQSIPYGEAHGYNTNVSTRLDYRKTLWQDKALIRYYGIYAYSLKKDRDSTTNIYNWSGQIIGQNNEGAEYNPIPTLRDGVTNGTVHRITANYKFMETLKLTVSDYYRFTEVKGEDPIYEARGKIDPNTFPSYLKRNILGAELKTKFFNNTITALLIYKHYSYISEAAQLLNIENLDNVPIREVTENNHGGGFALKYKFTPSFFVRGSYEQATRLPRGTEIFGNYNTIVPNYFIQPEKSNNWNVGINYSKAYSNSKFFSAQLEGFIRNQKDLIRTVVFGTEQLRFVNEANVDGIGAEFSSRFTPIKDLDVMVNLTKQSNTISTPGDDYGARVPNLAGFYTNTKVTYNFTRFFDSEIDLKFDVSYFYIDRFTITTNGFRDLDDANPDNIVPRQNLLNTGLVFTHPDKKIIIGFTVNNVLNSLIYDNFRIPRPGIHYALKMSYNLNKYE